MTSTQKSKNTNYLHYFKETYEDCRATFLQNAERLTQSGFETDRQTIEYSVENDDQLFIDMLSVSHTKASNVMVVISGTHGIEGYIGSAFQNILIDQLIREEITLKNTDILFIHGLNPWGFKYDARVTENNVDLNRNFDVSEDLFKVENEGYRKLDHLLNPTGPFTRNILSGVSFFIEMFFGIMKHSLYSYRQAACEGQYAFPKGIFFGGNRFEPHKKIIGPVFKEKTKGYKNIALIDLHSGIGQKSTLQVMKPAEEDPAEIQELTNKIFGHRIIDDDRGNIFKEHGALIDYLKKLCEPDQLCIRALFEFGSLIGDTVLGNMNIVKRLIDDNQGRMHGYSNQKNKAYVKKRLREAFYPRSEKWRNEVSRQFAELMPVVMNNFDRL